MEPVRSCGCICCLAEVIFHEIHSESDAVCVCAELYPSLKKTEETGQSFMYALQLCVAVTAPIFTKFTRSAEDFVKRSYAGTEFHENPTYVLLSDTRL